MNLYDTIGVDKKASQEEISKAFRKKASTLHPDHGGNQEVFKELSKAYGLLKSPEKRKIYDRTGDPNAAEQNPLINVAIQRILMAIDKVITKADDLLSVDIISVVKQHVQKIEPNMNTETRKTKDQIKTFRDLKKRFKFKKNKKSIEVDIVKNMLDDKIQMANTRLENLRNEIKIARIAINVLDCYKFKQDSKMQYVQSYSVNFSTTSATSSW